MSTCTRECEDSRGIARTSTPATRPTRAHVRFRLIGGTRITYVKMHAREYLRPTRVGVPRDPKRAVAGQQGMQDRVMRRMAVPGGHARMGDG